MTTPAAPARALSRLALVAALALVVSAAPAWAQEGKPRPPEERPAGKEAPGEKGPEQPPREGREKSPPATPSQETAGREDAITARARERYGFATWPGRDGPARDGIDLSQIHLPGLPAVSRDLRAAPGGPVATIRFGGSMRALVWVEPTAAAAQEALLVWLAGCTRPLERVSAAKGPLPFTQEGPGDVAYALADADGAAVAFARGNVVAAILGPGNMVAALASRIDALALESPTLDADRRARGPETIAIEAIPADDPEGAAARHEVRVRAVAKGGVVRREVTAEGALVSESEDGTVTLRARRGGAATLTVHALSPRGWRASLTTEVALP